MSNILVIGAHPDDEVLGLGGTLIKYSRKHSKIFALIFADGESARGNEKEIKKRQEQGRKAASVLGLTEIKFLGYKDQLLDDVPTLELVQQIEKSIRLWKPEIIFTHFWGDVNQDHRKLFEATLIAARATPYSKINQIICYETPSSTEWGNENFKPNLFVRVDNVLQKKIKALMQYEKEIEDYPHPRSIESITNRMKYWGSVVGINYAEAFVKIREIVKS